MEQLPIDIQVEHLKTNRYFRQLNKTLYSDLYANQMFVEQHCYKNISSDEFKNYILNYNVKQFVIYDEQDYNDFVVTFCKKLKNNQYYVKLIYLALDHIDVDEYKFDITTKTLKVSLNDILDMFLNDAYYDVDTIYNILKLRGCDLYKNNFSKDYSLKIYNDLTTINHVNDLDSLYKLLKSYLYMIDINNKFSLHKIASVNDIIFNQDGEVYDQNQLDWFVNIIKEDIKFIKKVI